MLQALLAIAVVGVSVRRLRVLLFVAPLDLAVFRDALGAALQGGHLALASTLCDACAPAFAAELARTGVRALERGEPLAPALDEARLEADHAIERGNVALLALGRMATPLAFITILLDLGQASGDRSLRALQRGLPLQRALDHALDAFALGLSTLVVAVVAAAIVRRSAHSLRHALDGVARCLVDAAKLPISAGFTPPRDAV